MGSKTMSDRQNAPKVLFFLFIIFTSSTPATYASDRPKSTTCAEVLSILTPCGPYAKGAAPFPPSEECCREFNVLGHILSYIPGSRRVFCTCYKDVAPSAGIKPELTQKVVLECGYSLYLPTDPHIDCKKSVKEQVFIWVLIFKSRL